MSRILTILQRPFAPHPVNLHTPLDIEACLARFPSCVGAVSLPTTLSSLPLIGELRQHSFTLRLNERNTLTIFEGNFTQQSDGTTITGQIAIPSALLLIFLLPGFLLMGALFGIHDLNFQDNWPIMSVTLLVCLLVTIVVVSNRPSDERAILQHVMTLFDAKHSEIV